MIERLANYDFNLVIHLFLCYFQVFIWNQKNCKKIKGNKTIKLSRKAELNCKEEKSNLLLGVTDQFTKLLVLQNNLLQIKIKIQEISEIEKDLKKNPNFSLWMPFSVAL